MVGHIIFTLLLVLMVIIVVLMVRALRAPHNTVPPHRPNDEAAYWKIADADANGKVIGWAAQDAEYAANNEVRDAMYYTALNGWYIVKGRGR